MPDIFDQITEPKGDIFDTVSAQPQDEPSFIKDVLYKSAKDVGGAVVGAGEIAANLATQTYGLPAKGYGEIANLATGRNDIADKVSEILIYNPQTEYGKAGMSHIAGLFDWWNKKSVGVGERVQEAVSPVLGEQAGVVAGSTVASTIEAAPLLLGEVYGKARGAITKRNAAKDYAEIKTKLAEDKRAQVEADISRAYLGDVIPEDPAIAGAAREAATRKSGMDIFDRIQEGYLGDAIPNKANPEVTPYDEFVMDPKSGMTPSDQLERYGMEVADRIQRGPLGDVVEPSVVKPDVAPMVGEYAGAKVATKELPKTATPEPPDFHAEAAKLESAPPVKYVGDMGGHPMFQQESPGVGSFIKKPGETVEQAYSRAKERYKSKGGNPLDNERGQAQIINDAARALKEFFSPFSTVPQGKEYLILRGEGLRGGLAKVDRITKILTDRMKGLSIQDKKDVFNAIRGEIPIDTLPEELRLITRQTIADSDRVGALLVRRGMLDQKTFDAHKGSYIHYMYLRHILPDDVSIPMGAGGMLDLSYLKKRLEARESGLSASAIETIRQDLGLIEDVSVSAPVGMGKALGDVAKKDFFKTVASNPDWVWQPSKEIAELKREHTAYRQIVERGDNVNPEVIAKYQQLTQALEAKSQSAGKAPDGFVQLPDTKSYGDLQGAFVRKEIANDLVPVYGVTPAELEGLARVWNNLGKGFDVGMTMFKVGKVALNPPTAARNTISNFMQMNMSGIPSYLVPDVVIDGVKSMIKKDKHHRAFENAGGFQTNFSVAELGEVLNQFEKAKGGGIAKFFVAVKDVAKYYGKIDDIAKMSLYKDAVTRRGMPHSDAVLYAQKWGMDYSLASRSVKHGRRYALPFLSYQYKIAPLIAESLVKQPWVIGKYFAIPYLMAKAAAWRYDWTDQDLDKTQKMLAERTKNQGEFMLLPLKDNKGNPEIVNMEYFFPWGNWLQTARDVKKTNFVDAAKQFGGILGPYGNVIAMLNTKRAGEPPKDPFTGQPVYSKLDSGSTKFIKQMEWWYQLFAPSSMSSRGALGYTYKAAMGQKDRWGVEATPAKAFGRWMGINVGSLDPRGVMATRKSKLRELDLEIHKIYRDPQSSPGDKKNALKQLQIERQKILRPE